MQRWRIETEVWNGESHQTVSISSLSFTPGEQFQAVLHDGRECMITMEVDEVEGIIRTEQIPLDESLPATAIERIFSEEGLVMTMMCGDVFAQSEFTRCVDEEDESYLY